MKQNSVPCMHSGIVAALCLVVCYDCTTHDMSLHAMERWNGGKAPHAKEHGQIQGKNSIAIHGKLLAQIEMSCVVQFSLATGGCADLDSALITINTFLAPHIYHRTMGRAQSWRVATLYLMK